MTSSMKAKSASRQILLTTMTAEEYQEDRSHSQEDQDFQAEFADLKLRHQRLH